MKLDSENKINQLPKTFYVTYYAKKHQAIITSFIYWDLDAEPNKNGNQWRQATGMITVKSADA